MKKISLRVQRRTFPLFVSLSLFALVFLFAGIGQTVAQPSSATVAALPYGGKTFLSNSNASQALQSQLPGLYTELNLLPDGTKAHKHKMLEILCYKGIVSDLSGGQQIIAAFEGNMAKLALNLNLQDPIDQNFMRGVHSDLFDLLTY